MALNLWSSKEEQDWRMAIETADSDTLKARIGSTKIAMSPAIDTEISGIEIPVEWVGDPHRNPNSNMLSIIEILKISLTVFRPLLSDYSINKLTLQV